MLQIAVAQTDGQTQQIQPLLCLWKNGEVVEKQRIPVDSIVVSVLPPQHLDRTTVRGLTPKLEQAIDMGLSVKWAPWNVGASKPYGRGAHFAWGEINASKESYDWGSYYWMTEGKDSCYSISKYQLDDNQRDADWYLLGTNLFVGDNKSVLLSCDDAVQPIGAVAGGCLPQQNLKSC